MTKNFTTAFLLAGALLSAGSTAWAQEKEVDLYDLSLDELMNVSVVSASKEEERLFDAPVAIHSVSREEISKAGVLSIPEALRLVPGVIVRETTNGNYDIHLRGFENPTHYTSATSQLNSLTLVMINNRPVFNYNQGGTFWESLPVGIVDVERIEVVAGPAAALFGPNAVTGVINIITREFNQKELMVSGQVQGTAPGNGLLGSIALGMQLSDKVTVGLTGNYQSRDRLDDEHYIYGSGYIKSQDYQKEATKNLGLRPELAINRQGTNAYINVTPAEEVEINFSAGLQQAEAQRVFLPFGTPLSFNESSSFYSNLNTRIKSLNLRFSYAKGQEELNKLSHPLSTAYDYKIAEATAEYNLRLSDKLKLRPSLSYQGTTYSDLDFLEGKVSGLFNAERSMGLLAGSLRADYTPTENLRLIASGRADKFDVREEAAISYQFAATYSLGSDWSFRASHGKSYSGLFYNTAFIDLHMPLGPNMDYAVVPNQDIALTSNTLSEIGVRAQLKGNLQADLALFSQKLENPMNMERTENMDISPEGKITVEYHFDALPITAHQLGLTASVNWVPNKQWQVRPFVTLQNSKLRNFDYYTGAPAEKDHDSTPSFFGGWFVSYTPMSRLNLSSSSYFFSRHTLYDQQDQDFENTEGAISGKFLLNARASYRLFDKLNVFAGAKNLLNQDTREFYGTDRIGSTFFAGLNYNW